MMRQIILLSFMLLLAFSSSQAQGIDFFKGEWAEALELAKSQDKLIFVDAYATWCGPCKRMAASVFPDEQVGAYYNRHFISLKIDMEAPENAEFRKSYPVSAFPTLFYIDGEGEVVSKVTGALQVKGFIDAGVKALALSEPSDDYAAAYEEGDRSPELVYKYVRSLIRNSEPHLRIANDYLRAQTDLNSSENLEFIMLAATEADSRIFTMMTDRKDAIVALHSEDTYLSQVYAACNATAEKAIEFSSHELLEEAWEKMEDHYPAKADRFALETELNYTEAHYDAKGFAKAARDAGKSYLKGDADGLQNLSMRIAGRFAADSRAMGIAEDLARDAIKADGGFGYHYTLANVLYLGGKYDEARRAAETARELAGDAGPRATRMIDTLLEKIEQG